MPAKDDYKSNKQPPGKYNVERSIASALLGQKTKDLSKHAEWYSQNIKAYDDLNKIADELYQQYYAKHGFKKENDPEINRKLIEALDKTIEKGHWEGGLFFEVAGKHLKELRDKLAKELDLGEKKEKHRVFEKQKLKEKQTQETEIEVYVSLYLATGENVAQWETVLSAVMKNSVGRPIYRNEKDIRTYLNSKPNKNRDTYVRVRINKSDILLPKNGGQYATDKFGNELLMLRDGAIRSENIIEFVHGTGVYQFKDGKLSPCK